MSSVLAPVDQLVAVVYVSAAQKDLNDAEILEILRAARQNNERLDITGMLLYREGKFLQVLEGPAGAVDQLMAKIKRDPRHGEVILLSRKTIDEREFADWRMAFRNMRKGDGAYLEQEFADEEETGEASQLVYRLLRRLKKEDIT